MATYSMQPVGNGAPAAPAAPAEPAAPAAETSTPWYQTWWAILLALFGGFLLMNFIVRPLIMRPPVN